MYGANLAGLLDGPARWAPDRPAILTGERPEPTFLITKPFQRSTVKAAIAQALFFDAATVPAV